jgi:hypothetical protein
MMTTEWRDVATFASGFEADFAVAQLEASGIPAVRATNDTAGIFGPASKARVPTG